MICKCKLPIIRGYEPDCYCLKCGLKLKNKKMKKIKDVIKLKKGYKYLSETGNFGTTFNYWILTKEVDLWITNCGLYKFSEATIRENPELFEDVYEEEQKFIYLKVTSDNDLSLKDIDDCLHNRLMIGGSYNIKVTEIKPSEISKEDAEWFYKKNYCSFKSAWAEFQEKKEAENG